MTLIRTSKNSSIATSGITVFFLNDHKPGTLYWLKLSHSNLQPISTPMAIPILIIEIALRIKTVGRFPALAIPRYSIPGTMTCSPQAGSSLHSLQRGELCRADWCSLGSHVPVGSGWVVEPLVVPGWDQKGPNGILGYVPRTNLFAAYFICFLASPYSWKNVKQRLSNKNVFLAFQLVACCEPLARLEYLRKKDVMWVIEQPSSSLLPFYKPMEAIWWVGILQNLCPYCVQHLLVWQGCPWLNSMMLGGPY